MKKSNAELPGTNLGENLNRPAVEKRSEKLERLKLAIAEGTYKVDDRKIAIILINQLVATSGVLNHELNIPNMVVDSLSRGRDSLPLSGV
jgi:hypothetical protein